MYFRRTPKNNRTIFVIVFGLASDLFLITLLPKAKGTTSYYNDKEKNGSTSL